MVIRVFRVKVACERKKKKRREKERKGKKKERLRGDYG